MAINIFIGGPWDNQVKQNEGRHNWQVLVPNPLFNNPMSIRLYNSEVPYLPLVRMTYELQLLLDDGGKRVLYYLCEGHSVAEGEDRVLKAIDEGRI